MAGSAAQSTAAVVAATTPLASSRSSVWRMPAVSMSVNGEPVTREGSQPHRVEVDVVGPDQHTRWDRIELDRPTMGLADDVLSHGPDVVLLDPPSVRDRVVARLTEAVG